MANSVEDLMQQCFTISTVERYADFAQQNNIPQVKEDLPGGGSVVWFGLTTAKRVLAFIPGGGLVMHASPFHINIGHEMYKTASAKHDDVAVAILAYDTCLIAPYPAQMSQAVGFVTHLLKRRDAENIELFGDSAAGALIVALLLHIDHPHPKVPPLSIPSGHSLGRILLISPAGAVSSSTVAASKNTGRDMMSVDDLRKMWEVIQANHDPEVDLINPWLTPQYIMYEGWYAGWPAGEITIVFGGLEILEEEIVRLSNVIKAKHHNTVDIYRAENAVHIAFIGEGMMGTEPSNYTRRIIQWAGL
ncbi:hypothetical protein F5884DRAFT_846660 [Xylogone sp. PMI_703]|nr:hypothetical protein F5884DRAFT_846660 [Xylogone sp. PMI_703]